MATCPFQFDGAALFGTVARDSAVHFPLVAACGPCRVGKNFKGAARCELNNTERLEGSFRRRGWPWMGCDTVIADPWLSAVT
jgi:hypothetical protein